MTKYSPPEGYVYDTNTGLYYSQVIAKNQEGITCQIVTWFNAETGEYSRNIYPVNDHVVKTEKENKDKPKQRAEHNSTDKSKQKSESNSKDKYGRKPKHKPKYSLKEGESIQYILLGMMGVLLLVILVGNISISIKKHNNSEKHLMKTANRLSEIESEDSINDNDDNEEIVEEASYSIDGDYTTVWRDTTERGFFGIHYMTVGQDDEYVYTIKAEGQSWYETDNIPYGALVRFKKTDIYNVETIIPREDPITAFAVMGDYIYYGRLNADGTCDYTRRNKNTGEEVFLLSEDYSLLAGDKGVLYFLFTEDDRNQLGMFDVATGEMNYRDIDYDFQTELEEPGNYSLFAPFGFYEDLLCIGGHMGDDLVFWSLIDLDADKIEYAKCRKKFLEGGLATDDASPETARYYRRYGLGAMLGTGEKNPYRVLEQEINGKIIMFSYYSDMDPDLVRILDTFGTEESQRFNRLEIPFYDIFTGERAETGNFGHGFTLRFNEYPQMALSFDNYPTGITRDFYIYNNYIIRLTGAHITEIVEY